MPTLPSPQALPEPFLTPAEVARWLGVERQSIYNSRARGVPPGSLGFKIGRRLRFDTATVQRWVDEQRESA